MISRRLTRTCPDCCAVAAGRHLDHAATCPVGRAEDERMAADRRWLQDHPGAQRYTRPISRAEVVELKIAGVVPDGWDAAGDVTVALLAPGVRTRPFGAVWMFQREVAA